MRAIIFTLLVLTTACKGYSRQSVAFTNQAIRKLNQQLPLEAINDLQRAIQEDGKNAIAHHVLAQAYEKLSRYDDAIASQTQATKYDPKNIKYWVELGDLNERKVQFLLEKKADTTIERENAQKSALAAYGEVIKLNPKHDQAYDSMGRLYEQLQDYKAAEEYYRRAIQANPTNLYAYDDLGVLYIDLGSYEAAAQVLANVSQMQIEKGDGELERVAHVSHIHLIEALYSARQIDKAIEECGKELNSSKPDFRAWKYLAILSYEQALEKSATDKTAALALLQKAEDALKKFRVEANSTEDRMTALSIAARIEPLKNTLGGGTLSQSTPAKRKSPVSTIDFSKD